MKTSQVPSEMRAALADLRPFFVRSAWFSMFASLLVLAPSGYMLEVYGRVVNSRNHETLVWLTVLVLGAYLLMEVLEWARSEIMRGAAEALDKKMHMRIFNAMFEANVRRVPGGQVNTLSDFKRICEFLYSPALLAIMEAPIALVMMVLLFLISPVLGWSAVVFGLLQVGITWMNERRTKPPLMAANRESMEAQRYADDTLNNAEVLEAMGMLKNTHRRWIAKQRKFLQLQAVASDSAGGFQALSKLVQNILSSLLLGLACWLLLHNELNGGGGMMVVASILGGRMLAPLVQVVGQWQSVVSVRDSWNRIEALLAAVPANPAAMALPPPAGRVQVEQLMAGAPGNPGTIVRGINLALQPGDVLAVVGPSASGKTTLARLLVGLWPATMGKVRLDGADIQAWNKKELGPHIGYLPQGVALFDGTLAENIARFGAVDMTRVEAAARAVGLHELISTLPEGYDTLVGPGGLRLSGGQRQRVGLARAFYGDPVYVVLDEPNSSLDEEGDIALSQAIKQASARGATVVVVTHRTSVLSVTNKLLVLRDGQQQAFGPRDEVLAALNQASRQAQMPVPTKPVAA
ncbi:type I secretion system permease/ATPase [Acidovorax sp. CCYZU-2555]|nr:type I secretion system permease/ATPase [Acidovorax sp. CCYZU-2555]MBS7777088.1 type I secretion system permease/ATPase [Acidovorax sp. CCYZU-2555]